MISEILAVMNIAEKLSRLWSWVLGNKVASIESVADRFIRLFESHDIHRNQIPRFFGHGLTIKDVQDEASLLAKLDCVFHAQLDTDSTRIWTVIP